MSRWRPEVRMQGWRISGVREPRKEGCLCCCGRQLMVLHLVSQLPRQAYCLPTGEGRLGSDVACLIVCHRLAHHHWVAQLLQRLHLVLDHLLDERVKVDGEGEEDLEVGHSQVLSVKLQEYLKLLLIPEIFKVCIYFPLVMIIRVNKSTCPFQARAPSPFEWGLLVSLGRKPGANDDFDQHVIVTCESGRESSSFSSQST